MGYYKNGDDDLTTLRTFSNIYIDAFKAVSSTMAKVVQIELIWRSVLTKLKTVHASAFHMYSEVTVLVL